jgi:hypothetical protein
VAPARFQAQELVDVLVELVVAQPLRSNPIAFMATIVGSSWNAAESRGLPPTRSPAETVTEWLAPARSRSR